MPLAQRIARGIEEQVLHCLLRDRAGAENKAALLQVVIHRLLEGDEIETAVFVEPAVLGQDHGTQQVLGENGKRHRLPAQPRPALVLRLLIFILAHEGRLRYRPVGDLVPVRPGQPEVNEIENQEQQKKTDGPAQHARGTLEQTLEAAFASSAP